MNFTKFITVEQIILAPVARRGGARPSVLRDAFTDHGESLSGELRPARGNYLLAAQIPRPGGDVIVEPWLRDALAQIDREIAVHPYCTDEAIYNLCARVVMSTGEEDV